MKFFYLTLIFILALGCGVRSTTEIRHPTYLQILDSVENRLLNQLDSAGQLKLNDSAKWLLYILQWSDSTRIGESYSGSRKLQKVPLAYLPLKLSSLSFDTSRVSLFYSFVIDDSTYLIESSNPARVPLTSVVFDKATDAVLGYWMGDAILDPSGPGQPKDAELKPAARKFLIDNYQKLDPWLRGQLKVRSLVP